MKIGFVGLGVMGVSMARNLGKRGFQVTVYNRSPEKASMLAAEGFAVAGSPAELGENVDAVCLCVTDGAAVHQLLLGPDGVLSRKHSVRLVVDFSTIAPVEAEQIGRELQPLGVSYLDAPVSGGDVGARDGTLTVMVGGDHSAFEEATPIFEAIGKKIIHLGSVGAGQRTKCVNQIAVAISVAAMTEAIVYAREGGLDVAQVLEVIGSGAAGSWALQNYAPRILRGELGPGFYAKHMVKDLRIAAREAEAANTSLPVAALVRELFTALCAGGGEDLGNHALIALYDRFSTERMNGGKGL